MFDLSAAPCRWSRCAEVLAVTPPQQVAFPAPLTSPVASAALGLVHVAANKFARSACSAGNPSQHGATVSLRTNVKRQKICNENNPFEHICIGNSQSPVYMVQKTNCLAIKFSAKKKSHICLGKHVVGPDREALRRVVETLSTYKSSVTTARGSDEEHQSGR